MLPIGEDGAIGVGGRVRVALSKGAGEVITGVASVGMSGRAETYRCKGILGVTLGPIFEIGASSRTGPWLLIVLVALADSIVLHSTGRLGCAFLIGGFGTAIFTAHTSHGT